MPGRIWTNGVDSRMDESTNQNEEVSSVDGSLAVDENPNTFWEVNPAGKSLYCTNYRLQLVVRMKLIQGAQFASSIRLPADFLFVIGSTGFGIKRSPLFTS